MTLETFEALLKSVAYFVEETLLATGVPVLTGLMVGMLLAVPLPRLGGQDVLFEPLFLVPVSIAIVVAYLRHRRSSRGPSRWVWIAPAIILIRCLFTWHPYMGEDYWRRVWNYYFWYGYYDGLSEWLVTAPFYCSVAYSITAQCLHRKAANQP